MSNWSEHAAANMIKLSQGNSLREAMREWGTTGGYEDTHSVGEVCELCEHEGLRYQYEIENRLTRHALWVGSTCITKFVPLYETALKWLVRKRNPNFYGVLRQRMKRDLVRSEHLVSWRRSRPLNPINLSSLVGEKSGKWVTVPASSS